MKRQVPIAVIVVPILLVVAAVGYFFLVKPKQDEAGRLDEEIAKLETMYDVALAAQRQPQVEETTIRVADLFRVTKAMPDEEDMAGIILELNSVAVASGVDFVSITPSGATVRSTYSAIPINLTFEGNYYDLTDFLFRLRNLVSVRDGELEAEGRLFTLDSLNLTGGSEGFPRITAALTVTAYVYSTTPPEAPAVPPTDTTSTEPTDTTATTPTEDGGDAAPLP
ncbi:MAG: type 4a pilus biogenesis protein PilO [Gaiellaceae bacterium]